MKFYIAASFSQQAEALDRRELVGSYAPSPPESEL